MYYKAVGRHQDTPLEYLTPFRRGILKVPMIGPRSLAKIYKDVSSFKKHDKVNKMNVKLK